MKIVPENVKKVLSEYIMKRCNHAENGWENSNQDEDTITGDFLGNLRTSGWITNENIRYQFNYKKFRGRGKDALEKRTGADGIITIEIEKDGKVYYKSFVFQAKKNGNNSINKQHDLMKKHFPNGNIIFRYGPNGYNIEGFNKKLTICAFISDEFLECNYGIEGLRYDSKKENLKKENKIFNNSEWIHELEIKVLI